MVIFTLYGYIGMATFYLVSQWLAQYGQFVVGLPYASAIKLLSIYTVGSLVCVFVTAAFVKEVFSSAIAMIIYTGLSMISLLLVCLFPTPMMVTGFAFVIGFAAAGGVLQLGATIMAMSFPNGKGKATGIFYTAGSIASFTIPLITAKLSQISIASIMWFDFSDRRYRLCDRPVHRLSSTAGSGGAKSVTHRSHRLKYNAKNNGYLHDKCSNRKEHHLSGRKPSFVYR